MAQLVLIKICCTIGFGVIIVAMGMLPLLFRDFHKGYLSLFSSFAGGILLATILLHLMPEVAMYGVDFKCILGVEMDYPIAEVAIAVGFILILLIETGIEEYQHHSEDGEHKPLLEPTSSAAPQETAPEITSADNTTTTAATKQAKTLGAFVMVVALAVHSALEGLAVGVASTIADTLTLFLAVIIHKLCLAFALGVKLQQENRTFTEHLVAVMVFAAASPIGVIVGIIITESLKANPLIIAMFVCNSLAAGAFLYITFMEILAPEFTTRHINQLLKVLAVVIGFLVIAVSLYLFHHYPKPYCGYVKAT